MSDNLTQKLDDVLEALTARLAPSARKKLAGKLALGLRERQAKRIRQQKNPNGTPYVPKKKREIKTYVGRLRFVYKGEVREINNWYNGGGKGEKGTVTGYDASKGSFRTFSRDDIEQYLAIELNKGAIRRAVNKGEMFRRIRTYQYLRVQYNSEGARVGFTGRAAAIARIHQFGMIDDLDKRFHGRYPERELLGLNDDDIHWMSGQIFTFISGER
jgi:phage virion morphogenesis protein